MLSFLGVNVNEMKCFRPLFYTVRTKLNQGQLGLMILIFFLYKTCLKAISIT